MTAEQMPNPGQKPSPYEITQSKAPGFEHVKEIKTDPTVDYLDALKFDPGMLDEESSRVTVPDIKRYSEQGFDLFLLEHLAKLFQRSSVLEVTSHRLEDIILDSKQYHALCDYLRYLSGLADGSKTEAESLLEVIESGRLLPSEVVQKIAVMLQKRDEYLKV